MGTTESTRRAHRGILVGFGLWLVTLIVAPVAGPAQPVAAKHVEHHATLHPSSVWWQYRHTSYCTVFLGACLIAANPQPSDGLPVGYTYHTYGSDDNGSSDAFQARVVFDLSEFQQYPLVPHDPVFARLTYQEDFFDRTDPPPLGSQGVTCVNRLRIAATDETQDGRFFMLDGDLFRAGLLNSDPWAVDEAAQGWIDGSIPNYGLVLQGYDESLDLKDDACLSALSNFSLQLGVIWDVQQPDLQVQNITVRDKNGLDTRPSTHDLCSAGSIRVGTTIHNDSDVGAPQTDVLLKVDGRAIETIIGRALGPYSDDTYNFETRLDLSAGSHTLQVLVDPDHKVGRIADSSDVATMTVNCARGAAPTPTPKPATLSVAAVEVQDADDGHPGCVAGKSSNVHVVIKNAGDASISDVLPLQLSVDGKPTATTSVGGVGANQQKDSYFPGVNLGLGNHTIKVTIDPDHKLALGTNPASIQVTCTKT